MKRFRTLRFVACLLLLAPFQSFLFAQSCAGNLLEDGGYYGGFELGASSIGTGRGATDLGYGSAHGDYQIVSTFNQTWSNVSGGGYLQLPAHSGNYLMLIHTDDSRQWYKTVAVRAGQTLNFCASIASAKAAPQTGFEVRLRVKYGNTTTVIGSAIAPQGKWAQVCGSFTVPAGVSSVEFQLVDPYPNTSVSNFLLLDDICLSDAIQLNPDINVSFVNVPVNGNVNTNDNVSTAASYGTPVAAAGNPAGATLTLNADGSYTFNATANTGVYVYTVPVCAASQNSNCPGSILTITVLQKAAGKNPPVAKTDFAETGAGKSVTLMTLANDAAGEANRSLNPASVSIAATPKHGTAQVNAATGAITYSPAAGFTGRDTLRYSVCDNATPSPLCASAMQIVWVKATGAANSTTADDDYYATTQGKPVADNVKTNDSDAEGDGQTITPKTAQISDKGVLVLKADGSFTFTPAPTFLGPVSFTYRTCDDRNPQACASATIYFLVQPLQAQSPLPVRLTNFSGALSGASVELNWRTAMELNSSHFLVEYSTNGQSWQAIGRVSAAGNSNSEKGYRFLHDNPVNGTNLYRLVSVDVDGSTTISNVITVAVAGAKTAVTAVYPNPFHDKLQVQVSAQAGGIALLQLYDVNGHLLQRTEKFLAKGENQVTIDNLQALERGSYFLKLTTSDTTRTVKIFK